MLRESTAVLYTSTVRDGAMAELSFHLGMLTPLPAKQMVLHGLQIETKKTIRIGRKDFLALGIDDNKFAEIAYDRAQLIGDAAAFLGYDGILVPSARWTCENLVAKSHRYSNTQVSALVEHRMLEGCCAGEMEGARRATGIFPARDRAPGAADGRIDPRLALRAHACCSVVGFG